MSLNWPELPGTSLGGRGRKSGNVLGNLPEIVNSRQSGFGKALTSAGWGEYQVHWGATESARPAEKCPTNVITQNTNGTNLTNEKILFCD